MRAKGGQNISLNALNGCKTIISDISLSHENEHAEEVVINYDTRTTSAKVVNPTSGSYRVLNDGVATLQLEQAQTV